MYSKTSTSPYDSQGMAVNSKLSPRYNQLSPTSINLGVIKKYNTVIFTWAVFSTIALAIYYYFSDGDFSFLMTYAALTRSFAFVLLNLRMFLKDHAKSVSLKALQLYAVVFAARLLSVMGHDGYLPYDSSGDYIYHLSEGASLFFTMSALFLVLTKYSRTYQKDYDAFGNGILPSQLGTLILLIPCVAAAVFIHPTLNNDLFSDTAWSLSMYLESVAIIPQLYMFQRSSNNRGVVEVLISHCVSALGLARVWDMELTDQTGSKNVGMLVLLTQFIHIAIMADFFYYYIIAIRSGGMMQLPTARSVV